MAKEFKYPKFDLIVQTERFKSREILNTILSQETKFHLNKYSSKSEDYEIYYNLWKNLLIDAISILKINDFRERYNRIYKKIHHDNNDFLLNGKYGNTRLYSSFGIDDLDKYFKEFIQFEGVLYGTDSNYRDHVKHVLQVWFIGIYILDNHINDFRFSDIQYVTKNFSFELTEQEIIDFYGNELKEYPTLFITKSEVIATWTIIALCHDLGYPVEKATRLNDKLKNILNYFGTSKFDEFHYDFGLLNKFLVEKFLDFTSSKIDISKKKDSKISSKDVINSKIGRTTIQSKYRDKLAKSLEEYKHGILGGLLLYKNLTYFLESDYSYDEQLPYEDLRQFSIRKEILRAISGHTCQKIYHLNIRNLSFLLILCDELQEWGRPNFDDLRSGLRIEDELTSINLDKLSFSQEGEVEMN